MKSLGSHWQVAHCFLILFLVTTLIGSKLYWAFGCCGRKLRCFASATAARSRQRNRQNKCMANGIKITEEFPQYCNKGGQVELSEFSSNDLVTRNETSSKAKTADASADCCQLLIHSENGVKVVGNGNGVAAKEVPV